MCFEITRIGQCLSQSISPKRITIIRLVHIMAQKCGRLMITSLSKEIFRNTLKFLSQARFTIICYPVTLHPQTVDVSSYCRDGRYGHDASCNFVTYHCTDICHRDAVSLMIYYLLPHRLHNKRTPRPLFIEI